MRITKIIAGLATSVWLLSVAYSADTYSLDSVHSNIGFSVRHLGITNVKGKFEDVSGTLVYDDKNVTKSSVKVTIKAASVNTDSNMRDKDLRSANFFETDKYPEITFVSKSVTKVKDGYILYGTFTMHGVSKDISIPFEILGTTKDPWGGTRMGVEGGVTINRQDYKMTYGTSIVGSDVKISLDAEWVKQK